MPAKDLQPFSTYLKLDSRKKLDHISDKIHLHSAAAVARMYIEEGISDYENRYGVIKIK